MPSLVILPARCASCDRPVELECKGREGFWGYESYNEYMCPHCGKRNVALTPGTIVTARGAMGVPSAIPV
jgi:predicted RNA-binding Zn-ribbon protein involved in translation (DUF1610 family)